MLKPEEPKMVIFACPVAPRKKPGLKPADGSGLNLYLYLTGVRVQA